MNEDRDPLDLVAEEFADRCRRGERPSVSEYVARHPDLAADLRDLLPAVAQMELLKKVRRPPGGSGTDAPAPKRLGDFRIVREIGRGGMGVVYEAIQESLGRRVALKLLPTHARMDPTKRERFLREAQAAAKLHHTNIVPVFGVGEEKGVPYYVMQYIPGCGLHDVIAGWRGEDVPGEAATVPNHHRPTRAVRDDETAKARPKSPLPRPGQWRAIARIALAAARALQEAHDQGVLHRDVKPGNLLIDPRGHVWVTDFGLAKLTDRDTLTATGDVMGTLQYMAPEALRGSTDERSDVYGLGMTLYELLTLRLPFDQSNPAILIKEIGEKDPLPPRAVNPKVPRDLETIVLTAIAREPHRRYASAGELADDLAAFLDDRPIRARRASPLDRAWRACRRNPAVAALSAVTAVALVSAAAFGWVMYGRATGALANESRLRADAEAARGEEARLRAEAVAARAKLEENLRLSLAAFEKVFEAAGRHEFPPHRPGDRPPPPPGPGGGRPPAADATAAMLEAVLDFYEKFAERNAAGPAADDSQLRFDAARAYRRVGDLNRLLRRPEKIDAAYARSAALLDELYRQYPAHPAVARELVITYSRLPPTRDRLAGFHRAAEAGESVRRRDPDPLAVGPPLLVVYWKLAQLHRLAGDPDAARRVTAAADELQKLLPPEPPGGGPPGDRPPPGPPPGRPPR